MPDSSPYPPVKPAIESARLVVTPDAAGKAGLLVEQSEIRLLEEAKKLVAKGQSGLAKQALK